MEKIKIALADDEVLIRRGIFYLLNQEENIEVIFEAGNGNELLDFLNEGNNLPDIILMDLRMPGLNGVETTKLVAKNFPFIKVIALTSYHSQSFILNMIEVGASSYLIKNETPQEMLKVINEVQQKGFYYTQAILDFINEESKVKNKASVLDENFLTSREKDVLQLICEQLNTSEIAEKLFLSPRTVEGHRNNLLLKTQSRNMAGLVIFAIQNKFYTLRS